jgi:hypothetical protein
MHTVFTNVRIWPKAEEPDPGSMFPLIGVERKRPTGPQIVEEAPNRRRLLTRR